MSDDRNKRIAERAFEIWEREGRPEGRDTEHWQQAEAEIAHEEAGATPPPRARERALKSKDKKKETPAKAASQASTKTKAEEVAAPSKKAAKTEKRAAKKK